MNFREFLLVKKELEAEGIISFYFERKDGETLSPFLPGQYVPLKIQVDGTDTILIRNYTLSDRPGLDYYRITVKKEENGMVSTLLHDKTQVGDVLWIGEPKGDFYLKDDDKPLVLISGGVGITPMISILESLAHANSKRIIYFLHSNSNNRSRVMKNKLNELKNSLVHLFKLIKHTQPEGDELQGLDFDKIGRIESEDIEGLIDNPRNCTYYLCGPNSFIDSMELILKKLEVSPTRILKEYFKGKKENENLNLALNPSLHEFSVNFKNSDVISNWSEAHQNLLNFAESLDIFPNNNCRMGTCNTCQTKLLDGDVVYDPEPFFEPEPGNILICCAKPISNLILEL